MTRLLLPFSALVLAAGTGACSKQEHLDTQVPPHRSDPNFVDWQEKYLKEVDHHYQTQQVKDWEIAALNLELEKRAVMLKTLQERTAVLETELAGRPARLSDAQKQLEVANELLGKSEANQAVIVRQFEVQLQQLAEMSERVEEYRKKVLQIDGVLQELQNARKEAEAKAKLLAETESKVVELARGRKRLEEEVEKLKKPKSPE